jgi:hypothetical protein
MLILNLQQNYKMLPVLTDPHGPKHVPGSLDKKGRSKGLSFINQKEASSSTGSGF